MVAGWYSVFALSVRAFHMRLFKSINHGEIGNRTFPVGFATFCWKIAVQTIRSNGDMSDRQAPTP